MEDAARTLGDFEDVIDAWDKEDKNRERRERYHEVCRDDAEVPFEYHMSPDEIVIPAPIQSVYWQQIMSLYNPIKEYEELVLTALGIGLDVMQKKASMEELKQKIQSFAEHFGLL